MRNYLIVVEGAHDIAVVEKLLKLNGVEQSIQSKDELPNVWKRTIPVEFPFQDGKLDRITPIPSFLKNDEISVAIKHAGGDTEIMNVLQQVLDGMFYEEKDQLDGIMLLCDADKKNAIDKKKAVLENLLLEAAQVVYPELLGLAQDYVMHASKYGKKLKKEQNAKKAQVGCIVNAMKPGKSNQVSIADDAWISEKTLQTCSMLQRLDAVVKEMISR